MRPFAGFAIASSLLLGSTCCDAVAVAVDLDAASPTYHRLAGAEKGKAGQGLKPALMQPAAVQPPWFGLHAHYDQNGKLTMQCEVVREARTTVEQAIHEEQEQ